MQLFYATAAITDAAVQIGHAADQTEQNHQRSLAAVQANAGNFGGTGSAAFQHAIATVNQKYADSQTVIKRAGAVLEQANQEMTGADGKSAGQYH